MNGVHDMGGMHGMGPIGPEQNEPVFHEDWERRTFALNLAAGFLGKWNIDIARYARERMPPAEYLAATYYERFLYGLEQLVVEHGLVSREELEGRAKVMRANDPELRPMQFAAVAGIVRTGRMARVDEDVPARFRLGDRVSTRNLHPLGHTRLPRYARDRSGVVEIDHGVFRFPDASAQGLAHKAQHVYAVRFTARELWGRQAAPNDAVLIDLWDDYLEAG